jgi:hypothetical protein
MRNNLICLTLLLLGYAFVNPAAADTFQSTWKAPDAGPLHFAGKKVAAIVLTKNPAARAAAEDLLAKKITGRGAEGITGYSLLTPSDLDDHEKAKSLLLKAGIAGAVLVRPVLAGGVQVGPDAWKDPRYRRFMDYPDSKEEKGKKVPFYVEVRLYSLEADKLMWAGKSATKAVDVDELITTISDGIVQELEKDGLIGKK